jgi:hypothetical protein
LAYYREIKEVKEIEEVREVKEGRSYTKLLSRDLVCSLTPAYDMPTTC